MRILILLLPLSLSSCQQAQAGTSDRTAVTRQADSVTSAPQAGITSASRDDSSGITDPEGPRPGESVEQEKTTTNAVFLAQRIDTTWASAQETKFRAAFAATQQERALVRVECRETLCKLELLDDASRGRRRTKEAIARAMDSDDGFIGSFSHVQYGDLDRIHVTMYVSRNHYSLPDKDGQITDLPKRRPVP